VWGQGGEITQALYAHMNNKTIKKSMVVIIRNVQTILEGNYKICMYIFETRSYYIAQAGLNS
jgi:hypothetical protein